MNDYHNALATLFIHRSLGSEISARSSDASLQRERAGPPRTTEPIRPALLRRVRRTGVGAWNRVEQRLSTWRRRNATPKGE